MAQLTRSLPADLGWQHWEQDQSRTWCLAVFCGAALPGGVLSFSNSTKHLLAFPKATGPVLAGLVAEHLPPLCVHVRYLQHGPAADPLTPSCSRLHLQLVSESSPAAWLLTPASSCSLQPIRVPRSLHTRTSVQGCGRAGLRSPRPHGDHRRGAGGEHRHGGVGRDGELGTQGGLDFAPVCEARDTCQRSAHGGVLMVPTVRRCLCALGAARPGDAAPRVSM